MTSRRCDVLRGSWCAAAGELALRLLSCTSMSFQAGDDGSITRLRRTAVCCGDGAGGRFPSVSLDTLLADISTDAAFCARSVVWRVYHERSDRRSQEQRNAARVREHPCLDLFTSVPSPELRARAEPAMASRVHDSLRPTFSTRRLQHRVHPLAAGVLAPFGIELQPAVGGILMMVSTIIVAINAQLLRGCAYNWFYRTGAQEFIDSADHERRTSTADLLLCAPESPLKHGGGRNVSQIGRL
jgi:hypothetical protein